MEFHNGENKISCSKKYNWLFKMSVVDVAPLNSSNSDDFAAFLDTELESTPNTSPEPEEDADETHHSDINRTKRQKIEVMESDSAANESTSQHETTLAVDASVKKNICTHPSGMLGLCTKCGEKWDNQSGVRLELLPYHVVADYEAEEDDRILDSDISAQPLSRSQQWDNNIYNKVAEFTATFEKQVNDFNDISRKQAIGEFRSEERLMVEQILLQEERRALYEARAELETRQKESLEAQAASLRMAAIAQAEQLRAESQARAEMMARGSIRASAIRAHEFFDQEQEVNMDAMNGWANNMQRSEKEPFEDFLNDEERDNGDMGIQSDWCEGREFDLNKS
ncbi:hypothetical protein CTI12_AA602210 [Artemisia annua]|uniref:GLTSCR protein conserved domain-containing protein n=1 Tax=Artemisia annua TaxID=35608 RepID=A0A2U1KHF4_ARTAN|nr:hypothetical protein CTI12_AA602210 [Artemisia annua]